MQEDQNLEPKKTTSKGKYLQKKGTNKGQILFWVIVCALVAVIIFCLVQIIGKYWTDGVEENKNENLRDSKVANTTGVRPSRYTYSTNTRPTAPTSPTSPTLDAPVEEPSEPLDVPEGMIKEYQLMYTLNNDMVGWIEIPGTSIDYPVVQSPYQSNFYLRRNFYKEKATCGTIYVREKCDVSKPSDNVTLYGHNMSNGTMFADLHEYEKKSFWQDNKLIYFDTLFEYHTYEIFAVFISSADMTKGFSYHTFDDAANEAEFNQFVQTCKGKSLYDTGITPKYGEKLITLSTCDKSIEDGRFVVVARRIM